MPGLFLSAAHRSSGKTTVALGLAAALARRGLAVQPFKKGPDYIDPMWLSRAAGRPCINLDPTLMPGAELEALYGRYAADADLALVEGNLGLHDGYAADGRDSNAALARRLALPVVLVIDGRGLSRGIAPLVLGQQAFDPEVRIGGVILNQVSGARHEAKLRAAIETYTALPVLGAVMQDARLATPERHLGLTTIGEVDDADARLAAIGAIIAAQVDLDRIRALAATAGPLPVTLADARPVPLPRPKGRRVRIGIARDRAFCFYYPDDLAALEAAGAELLPFDTLRDTRLPQADGLFIGGGFPEQWMDALESNAAMRGALRTAIEAGLPTYAECGGLMYLARSIRWKGRSARMVGVIPGDAVMQTRAVGRGYVTLEETADFPWPRGANATVRAHEFHHSSLENLDPACRFAWRVARGHGIDGRHDGIVQGRLLASYAHLRSVAGTGWAARFVEFVRQADARKAPHRAAAHGRRRSFDTSGVPA